MTVDALFTLIILLVLAVLIPLLGIRDHRILLGRIREGDAGARMWFYRGVVLFHWPLTFGFLAWWLLSGNSLAAIGLVPEAAGSQWISIGAGVLVALSQITYLVIVSGNAEKLAAIREQLGELALLGPQTDQERRWFDMVSITAGICEEILYRGLLLATLTALLGTWPAVAISSILFGLGHAYQGVSGILKTGMVGLGLALLTVSSGSLFVAMLLHTVIDLNSGRLMARAHRSSVDDAGVPGTTEA